MISEVEHAKKPPGMPKWLAVCLGFVGLTEPSTARVVYSEQKAPALPAGEKAAKPTKPPTDWRKIALVKEYTLVKQVGKGGFSEIWLAEHRKTKEKVALKVVQLTNADLEPEEVATLIAEAKFLRTLDCPYLIKCKETTHTADWLVLVLEYISGGEMLEHLHQVKKYTEAEAAKLFAQVVSAVSYLHNLNVIHRDLKPENIMFAQPVEQCQAEGRPLRVKLIDLGMATLYDPKKEVIGCVGTPGFVAPEIWNDKPHTFALDIYSLGVVLFIMLTGRKPHSGLDIRKMTYCNKSIHDAPGLKDERFLALSAPARELLLSMLSDDPLDRPSCLAVLQHPFITAVDSNMDAHREMGEDVRRRMRDLARIRKLHGLRYAMHVHRPAGASQQAFLDVLDRRRLRLKGDPTAASDASSEASRFPRNSLCGSYDDLPSGAGGGGGGGFCRVSNSGAAATGGGGGGGGGSALDLDKLALLAAMPELNHCATMPPVRMGGWHPPLSPVPSCDPSMYNNVEEAALPRGWSAHPAMYEALLHKDALLEGLALGAGTGPLAGVGGAPETGVGAQGPEPPSGAPERGEQGPAGAAAEGASAEAETGRAAGADA